MQEMSDKQPSQGISMKESEFLYDSLAEILSANRPIEGAEEAFNCASTISDVLHFLGKVLSNIDLSDRDRSAVSEILGALELVARRIVEWERKAIGIGTLDSSDIKYVRGRSERKE